MRNAEADNAQPEAQACLANRRKRPCPGSDFLDASSRFACVQLISASALLAIHPVPPCQSRLWTG